MAKGKNKKSAPKMNDVGRFNHQRMESLTLDHKEDEKTFLSEAQVIVDRMKDMSDKYGPYWLDHLHDFEGSSLLSDYQESICRIKNKSTKEHNITHLLYHMMDKHSISFSEMSISPNAGNLANAFKKSVQSIYNLENSSKSYAWFSNMKLPNTFAKSRNVNPYYEEIMFALCGIDPYAEGFNKDRFEYDESKVKTEVEIRRIHLLYNDFILNKDDDQLLKLLATLFVEYFMRIDSKILNVVNYKDCREQIYHFEKSNLKTSNGYLLDFVLFYNNKDYNNLLFQNHNSLYADFCYERIDKPETSDEYDKRGVYYINDYNTFHVLKSYYLSLWEKDKYIKYLSKTDIFKDPFGGIKTSIEKTIDLYDKNFDILNLFTYWKEIRTNSITNEKVFKFIFTDLYPWRLYRKIYNDKSEISKITDKLFDDLGDFYRDNIPSFIDNNTNSLKEAFDEKFKNFFLRKKVNKKEMIIYDISKLYEKDINTIKILFDAIDSEGFETIVNELEAKYLNKDNSNNKI